MGPEGFERPGSGPLSGVRGPSHRNAIRLHSERALYQRNSDWSLYRAYKQ
jgi:hypothetical protein